MEPILPRASIEASALAAADRGEHIDVTNPHPADTEAHALWELTYMAALDECEVGCV